MDIQLVSLNARIEGYEQLIRMYHSAHNSIDNIISLDFTNAPWVDANLCAPLGALLHRLKGEGRTVRIGSLNDQVKKVFCKNAFLQDFGMTLQADTGRTTMKYSRFEPSDEKIFPGYIETHFQGKGIPAMSSGLTSRFRESLLELFSNAVLHSETKYGIFVCGQYFPRRKRLDFSIVDMGVGIRQNILNKKRLKLRADAAIAWALEGNNTTKTGAIPGGLGLKLIREFIQLNEGRIQIVSDSGYWETQKNGAYYRVLDAAFPGTLVNIEINTADKRSYQLASESFPDNVL